MTRSGDKASQAEPEITPALLSTKAIVILVGSLLAASLLAWPLDDSLGTVLLVMAVVTGLFFAITTPLAYRAARKAGEWPPKDQRRG